MKRLTLGFLIAAFLALPLVAQGGLDVNVSIGQNKLDLLKDALASPRFTLGMAQPPVVDDAYVTAWVKDRCKGNIDQAVNQYERDEAQAGGTLDVSALTRSQRQQVKALIASFQK